MTQAWLICVTGPCLLEGVKKLWKSGIKVGPDERNLKSWLDSERMMRFLTPLATMISETMVAFAVDQTLRLLWVSVPTFVLMMSP